MAADANGSARPPERTPAPPDGRMGVPAPALGWEEMWNVLSGFVSACRDTPEPDDAKRIGEFMAELEQERRAPIVEWIRSKSGRSGS